MKRIFNCVSAWWKHKKQSLLCYWSIFYIIATTNIFSLSLLIWSIKLSRCEQPNQYKCEELKEAEPWSVWHLALCPSLLLCFYRVWDIGPSEAFEIYSSSNLWFKLIHHWSVEKSIFRSWWPEEIEFKTYEREKLTPISMTFREAAWWNYQTNDRLWRYYQIKSVCIGASLSLKYIKCNNIYFFLKCIEYNFIFPAF